MTPEPVILYVEDDAQSREVLEVLARELLGVQHMTILADSATFLECVQTMNPPPNAILLDIHVQPYNGFEMLAMVRAIPALRDVPVVALTASVMNEEVKRLRAAGFNGVIPKPVDLDQFPALLSEMLNKQDLWDALP